MSSNAEAVKRFRENHPERWREIQSKWRDTHREQVRKYQREYKRAYRARKKAEKETEA